MRNEFSISRSSSSRCQAPVESGSLSEICSPVPDSSGGVFFSKIVTNSRSRLELALEFARVEGQPTGKEEKIDTSDENLPLLVLKRHHRLRYQVHRVLMCRGGNLERSLKQRAVKALAARRSRRTVLARFLK